MQVSESTPLPLKRVVVTTPLTARQKKYLHESLPTDVRRILERAESFEVLAEVDKDERSESDSRDFRPNMIARIGSDALKKEILEAFYLDAAKEDSPAVCYEPHHSLRATAGGTTVEVEICFSCSRFVVKGGQKESWGTIVRENRRSENLLDRIVRESGVRLEH
jgi:hypothetical protein